MAIPSKFLPLFTTKTMQIKYGSVFGNYRWDASVEITPEQAALLAPLGALQVAQRSPSTAAEKEMAGYEKRPKGFTRTQIPFSTEGAEVLRKHQSVLEIPIGEDANGKVQTVKLNATVGVEQYFGTEADVKMTDERNAYARNAEAGKLEQLAKKVGYTGDLGDGAAVEAPVEFLRAIRAWSKEMVKNI